MGHILFGDPICLLSGLHETLEDVIRFRKLNLGHLWISLDKIYGDHLISLSVCLFIRIVRVTLFHERV